MNVRDKTYKFAFFCFCFFLSIIFIFRLHNIIRSEYVYLPTACTINNIRVTEGQSYRNTIKYNLLHVEVSYKIDGVFYDNELYDGSVTDDFKDDSYIKKFPELFPIHSQQTCWYDPSSPQTIILNKVKNFYFTVFKWIVILLIFISIALFCSVIPWVKKLKRF